MNWLKALGGAVGALVIISGAVLGFEYHYAKEADLQLIAYRLDQKIQQDRYWFLKQQYPKLCTPQHRREDPSVDKQCVDMEVEIYNIEHPKGPGGK